MNDDHYNSNNDINLVLDEIKENFTKYKNSYNKKEIIRASLENQDIPKLLIILTDKEHIDIVTYILENYSFKMTQDDEKNKTGKHNYVELFFHSIKKNKYFITECMIINDYIDLLEIKDSENNSPLIVAAIHSNIQIAKLLLKHCPELLEMKNKHGIDALTISVYNNDNLMFFLIANNMTYTILNLNELCKLAVRNENYEILEYITLNKTYTDDPLLMHHACAQKNLQIFEHVVNLSKKYEERDTNDETPLHWAVLRSSYHIVSSLLKVLKENHVEIDSKSKFGITPFVLALIKQDKNVCQLLFESGGNVNELDIEGNTIIHMIAAVGDLKWLKYVVKHFHANCYLKNNKGNTPFMTAIFNGRYDVVEYFIDKIPNLNWKNKYGQTSLHAAVFTNQIKIIELLLKNKADITLKDINDLTPYHYAYIEKKAEVIKIIHSILNLDKN